jgi:LDH2 family malate/lactate/ureidoglycolate dehydrogenase
MSTVSVQADRLQEICCAILLHAGLASEDAAYVAQSLVEADLKGVHSHGVLRLPRYVQELAKGITNPNPNIHVATQGPSCACIDGDHALGQLVGRFAMDLCLEKASTTGSATVTCGRSHHFGAAGQFAARALDHDMIGIAMTVASPRLAPTGGRTPLFGNNPIAYAVPADLGFPLLFDAAMGALAAGKLELAAANGTPIPAGLARDADGQPTTDAALALKGMIEPIGDYKGYGLTLFVELLAGLMAGSPYFGVERDAVPEHLADVGIGHCFISIDPSRFMPVDAFKQAVGEMARRIKQSPRHEGVDEILLPGEIEDRRRRHGLEHGIDLASSSVEVLRELGRPCNASL